MSIQSVLSAYAKAWKAGDLTAIVEAYHEDFVLHYFGTSPLAGTHRGKQAALTVLAQATERSARELVEVQDVLAGERFGALLAVERLGPERRELRRVLLYAVRDERLAECWLYDSDQPFVDALWAAPSA